MEFRSHLAQNLMQPFPHPVMLQMKFDSISLLDSEIFMFESVNLPADAQMPARVPSYKLPQPKLCYNCVKNDV